MKTKSEIKGLIFDLQCQIDIYRKERKTYKVAELRLEIERLQAVRRNMENPT